MYRLPLSWTPIFHFSMSRCIDRKFLHVRLKICYDIFKVISDNRTILLLLFSWCYVWLYDPMDRCRPGFPVLPHILEFAQAHIHWVGDAIQPSHPVIPFSCLQSFPESGSFPLTLLFTSGNQSIRAAASASVLPVNIQGWFPLGLTGLISLLLRDSQESSSTPQFECISSLVLGFLYGSTLTSIHDYWKNHSLDYMDLCWQSNVSVL